jgi:hypothetical protein
MNVNTMCTYNMNVRGCDNFRPISSTSTSAYVLETWHLNKNCFEDVSVYLKWTAAADGKESVSPLPPPTYALNVNFHLGKKYEKGKGKMEEMLKRKEEERRKYKDSGTLSGRRKF